MYLTSHQGFLHDTEHLKHQLPSYLRLMNSSMGLFLHSLQKYYSLLDMDYTLTLKEICSIMQINNAGITYVRYSTAFMMQQSHCLRATRKWRSC